MNNFFIILLSIFFSSCFVYIPKDSKVPIVLYNFTEKPIDVYMVNKKVSLNYYSSLNNENAKLSEETDYAKNISNYKNENYICSLNYKEEKYLDIVLQYRMTLQTLLIISFQASEVWRLIFPDNKQYITGILVVEKGKEITSGKIFCLQEMTKEYDYKFALNDKDQLVSYKSYIYMKYKIDEYFSKILAPPSIGVQVNWDKCVSNFTYDKKLYVSPNESVFIDYNEEFYKFNTYIKNVSDKIIKVELSSKNLNSVIEYQLEPGEFMKSNEIFIQLYKTNLHNNVFYAEEKTDANIDIKYFATDNIDKIKNYSINANYFKIAGDIQSNESFTYSLKDDKFIFKVGM